MGKQSDYLDRFSDKAGFNYDSGADFATSILHPAAGLGMRAAQKALQAEEMAGLVDVKYFANKRDQVIYSNAAALSFGLFWVGLQKNKRLSSASTYVSDSAKRLLDENAVSFNAKVQIDVSEQALMSDSPDPSNFFTAPNAASISAEQRKSLLPIEPKLLQPEVAHKQITVYTDQRVAAPFVSNSLALVGIDDLIAFAGKKFKIVVNFGKNSTVYSGAELAEQKEKYAEYLRKQEDMKNKLIPSADEWKCPNCGVINKNYVGTCRCGTSKPR